MSDSTLNTRYALTALDYRFKDQAVPDELLIDKSNGDLYYKRQDGEIVKCGSIAEEDLQHIMEMIENSGSNTIVSVERPSDTEWKPGGSWFEIVRTLGPDVTDVTFTNTSFNKDDVEKFLIVKTEPIVSELDMSGENPSSFVFKILPREN